MRANRSRDTTPELALRRVLHGRGLRYRVHVRPLATLRCEADVVFTRQRVAVFIDGCFWHGCAEHRPLPRANRDYWRAKLTRNVERDRRNDEALRSAGWQVLRFFEHVDPEEAADIVEAAVAGRQISTQPLPRS